MALIKCSECGQMVSDKASTCPKCGAPIVVPVTCKECGQSVSPNAVTCPNCGAPLKATRKCSECGKQIPEDAESCPYCGYSGKVSAAPNGEQPRLTFSESLSVCFSKKYATFTGRARRSEFWYFYLFNMIISFSLNILMSAFMGSSMYMVMMVILWLYSLAVLVPNLAVTVRRLHDIGKSGWNFLWVFLPIIGVILLLIWLVKDSSKGENKYGASPKYN